MFFCCLVRDCSPQICNVLLLLRMMSYPHLRKIPVAPHFSWSSRVRTPTTWILRAFLYGSQETRGTSMSSVPTRFMQQKLRCISLNPLFFSQKNTFFFPRKQKQIYSKYLPSLTIHFSHLSDNLCIPRQKNSSFFEANHSSSHFLTSS